MRQRGLVVAVAFLMAMGATAAVFLYVRGVRDEAKTGGALVTVIVPTEDIPAGTDLNPLIDQGKFEESAVPEDALVDGAVSTLEQLRGQTTTSAILANEQIPAGRLSSGALPGGSLGIQKGYQGVAVQLQAEQMIGPAIQRGDQVAVYVWFDEGVATPHGFKLIDPTEPQKAAEAFGGPDGVVVSINPDVRVLAVDSGVTDAARQSPDEDALVTLELTAEDVERLVFAQREGAVWLALLPPGDEQVAPAPVSFLQLVSKK